MAFYRVIHIFYFFIGKAQTGKPVNTIIKITAGFMHIIVYIKINVAFN